MLARATLNAKSCLPRPFGARMMSRKVVATANAPAALGPYSQAIVANGFVFISGQLPINPATGEMEGADISAQTRRVLSNIEGILNASGSSIANVVKTTVFLDDIKEWPAMNEVYAEVFKSAPPARSAFEVAKLPKDAKVEIETIAKLNE